MAQALVSFKLSGDKELIAAFEALPKAAAKSTLLAAGKKSLQVTRNEAEGYALTGGADGDLQRITGRYADSWVVGTKLKKSQRNANDGAYGVTVYCGSTDRKAHLLEFGHRAVNGGFVKPRPVLRPAWDQTKDQVLEIFRTEIWTQLLKTARRLRKRATKLGGQLGLS